MSADKPAPNTGQPRSANHPEPSRPGPASHAEKAVRDAPDISDADKRKLGEEASREEDA